MIAPVSIDGRMFEAHDAWEEYAKEHEWENPWDKEEEIVSKYRHREEMEFGWRIWTDDLSPEDDLRLKLNCEYRDKYIKRRDLFLFYQYLQWMTWDQIQIFIPKWCKNCFYPCDVDGQCSLSCEWWPCQNNTRKIPDMEELMKLIG